MKKHNKVMRSYWERMARQISILGEQGQKKIASTRLWIAGCGGTGSSVALEAGLAGFIDITLIDHDKFEIHNLNRIPLAGIGDVGEFKVLIEKDSLQERFPEMRIPAITEDVRNPGVWEQISDCTWMVDATDDVEAKRFLNRKCIQNRLPLLSIGSGFIIRNGRLVGAGCCLNRVRPGDACLECSILDAQPMQQAQSSLGVLNMIGAVLVVEFLLREITGYAEQSSDEEHPGVQHPAQSRAMSSGGKNFIFFDLLRRTITAQRILPTPGCTWCKELNSASK